MSSAGAPAGLELQITRKAYRAASGEAFDVLDGVKLRLARGEVAAVVGPSGCGKTTILRIVAGLDADFDGAVALPAGNRLGMVFQEPRLLPWRTVADNVRLAAPAASADLIAQLFAMLGLAQHTRHYPSELSLGLARRVALARAFAIVPDVLLLDEPFVSLDATLAQELRHELAVLVGQRPVTTLLVTHDIDEAVELADRVVLLSPRPARVISEIAIDAPRSARTPAELVRLRDLVRERL